jgi:hypothetical protein
MRSPRTFVWYFLVLALLGAAAVVIPIVYNLNQLLTPEKLAEAEALWERNGPASYDLRLIDRSGSDERGDVYEVRVRQGEVVGLSVNGQAQAVAKLSAEQRRGWTVPGLFDRMRAQLAEEEQGKRRNFATASFDKGLGYPNRYVRRVRGTRDRLEWLISLEPR